MGSYQGTTGGDGMTLTFHNNPRGVNASGEKGANLGADGISRFSPTGGSTKIDNAISFEIDTFVNDGTNGMDQGISETHMAFVYPDNPVGAGNHHQLTLLPQTDFTFDNWHLFNFELIPNADGSAIFRVSVYGRTVEHRVENYASTFDGTTGHFGFTSSTGGATQMNAVAFTSVPKADISVSSDITNERGDSIGNHGLTAAGHTLDYSFALTKNDGIYAYRARNFTFELDDDLAIIGDATITLPDNTQIKRSIEIDGDEYEIDLGNENVLEEEEIKVGFKVRVKDDRYNSTIVQKASFQDLANQGTPVEELTFELISANSIIDLDNKVAIEAFNRAIHINDVNTLDSEAAILGHMGALTRSILDSRVPMQSRTSQTSVPAQVGVLPIIITDESGISEKAVELYVYDDTAIINDTYSLSANNFVITSGEVGNLTDTIILENAKASARNYITGQAATPIVTWSELYPIAGVYPVVVGISEDSSLTKTIYVTVIDDNTVIHNGYALHAENFIIDIADVTDLDILARSSVRAWNVWM